MRNRAKDLSAIFGVALVAALLPVQLPEFYRYLIILIGVYAIAALGLNIFMGYCGQIHLGSAAFFCIGAYVPTMLRVKFGVHYAVGFPLALAFSLVLAWALSYPLLRLKGHAMAIGTLSFGMAVFLIAERFPALTGGADGTKVPALTIFGDEVGDLFYYYCTLGCLLVTYVHCYFLMDSRIGRALKAIKDDDDAAAALGINITYYKAFAWVIGNGLITVAGTLFALQSGFLSPSSFGLWANVTVLVMICVGGLGSNVGSVIGAAIMTLIPYFLVSIQEYIVLAQGVILFLVLRFMPEGIVGTVPKLLRSFLRDRNDKRKKREAVAWTKE